MPSPILSPEVDVLQFLHSDWQTVNALLSEIRAPDDNALPGNDIGILISRLCARVYALSRIEVELLYPCVDSPPLMESGAHMHEQMLAALHSVLDAMVGQDKVDASLAILAKDIGSLHRFDMDVIYPRCQQSNLDGICGPMLRRRIELLESFKQE